MSTVSQLPASAVRLFKQATEVSLEGLGTPGQKATASETWQVPMADRTDFLNTVAGTVEIVGGFGGAVARVVPLRHPEYPNLLAVSARSKGKGWDGDEGFWAFADITVMFETRPYDLSGQNAFLSRSGQGSVRGIPGPAANFLLGGVTPGFDPGEQIYGEEFSFTTHNLPTLPMSIYNTARNCVNSSAFFEYPPGTVLYNGPQYNQTQTIGGVTQWEVSHSFIYSKVPWNYYFASDGTLGVLTRADGSLKYEEQDLTTIFSA